MMANSLRNWMVDLLGILYLWVNGSQQPQSSGLEFLGSGVTSVYDPTTNRNKITIPGDAILSDWQSYTPNLAGGTSFSLGNGTVSGKFRRVGDSFEISVVLIWGSTTSLSGQLFIGIPAILGPVSTSIDTNKLADEFYIAGSGYLADNSTPANNKMCYPAYADPQHFKLSPTGTATSVDNTTPWTWATGDLVLVSCIIPFRVDPL